MSERAPLELGTPQREWEGSVHNPQTGHDLRFKVSEYDGGLSKVEVKDPTKMDVETGVIPVKPVLVTAKPVDSMTWADRRNFNRQVMAIAERPIKPQE